MQGTALGVVLTHCGLIKAGRSWNLSLGARRVEILKEMTKHVDVAGNGLADRGSTPLISTNYIYLEVNVLEMLSYIVWHFLF